MPICRLCGKDKRYAASCIKVFEDQIPFGSETWTDLALDGKQSFCPDCGVRMGGYHHINCDFEECPECRGKLLSCECDREAKIIQAGR